MSDQRNISDAEEAVEAIDQRESIEAIREALVRAHKALAETPDDSNPVDRARALANIVEPLLALGLGVESWQYAREAFSVFVDYEHWQEAVEVADILHRCVEPASIVALGHGIWLAVTYPVETQSTVTLLGHVIDETPDDSDGAAVAPWRRTISPACAPKVKNVPA